MTDTFDHNPIKWRPIESAPKDRNAVLVSDGDYVLRAFWNGDPHIWEAENVPCWTVHEPDDYFYSWHLNDKPPTHWMPLPEPPQ